MSERSHKNFFRILRVDQNPRNLTRILQSDMPPRLPAILGLIHPIPISDVRAHVRLARPHINDQRIRRRHRNRPNRSNPLRIEYRFPSAPRVVAAPHAPIHGAKIKNLRLPAHASNRQRPPSSRWPNRPPPHPLKQSPVIFLSVSRRAHHPPYEK